MVSNQHERSYAVERSSVFASEIFTDAYPIPEVIHKTEITKKNNLEVFKSSSINHKKSPEIQES